MVWGTFYRGAEGRGDPLTVSGDDKIVGIRSEDSRYTLPEETKPFREREVWDIKNYFGKDLLPDLSTI